MYSEIYENLCSLASLGLLELHPFHLQDFYSINSRQEIVILSTK